MQRTVTTDRNYKRYQLFIATAHSAHVSSPARARRPAPAFPAIPRHGPLRDLPRRPARPRAGAPRRGRRPRPPRPEAVPGGVTIKGGWPEVWRANLRLRGAGRVLARIAAFRALHLAQLDKRARKLPWGDILRPDVPFRVEATCRASRASTTPAPPASRIATAIAETLGAPSPRPPTPTP